MIVFIPHLTLLVDLSVVFYSAGLKALMTTVLYQQGVDRPALQLIDYLRFYVCRKRRLNGAILRMRPGKKPTPRVTAGVAR
jgi:hypothetical protein